MKIKLLTLLISLLSFTKFTNHTNTVEPTKPSTYSLLIGDNLPSEESFNAAMTGFMSYKQSKKVKKNILTIVDFNLSSTKKRLWVIDLDSKRVLFNTLVSHGKNTGDEYARSFSNMCDSNKSSLGFYATGEVYNGKHGKSLKLDGLEKGKNDNARRRGVVIHGADYVSDKFIKTHNRLGRSQGCPALPVELSDDIINVVKDKSCVFIYYNS